MEYTFNDKTVLLLKGDNYIDNSPRPKTVTNSNSNSNAFSRFGGYSHSFFSSQYILITSNPEFDLSNGDFTIDWWEFATTTYSGAIFSTTGGTGFYFGKGESGKVQYMVSPTSSVDSRFPAKDMGNIKIKQWVHRAIVRDKNFIRTYENGVLTSEVDYGDNIIYYGNQNLYFGRHPSYYTSCYIDEFRVTKEAVWKSNFDVPTREYIGLSINHSYIGDDYNFNIHGVTSNYTIDKVLISFNGGGVKEVVSNFDNIDYTLPKELKGIGKSEIKVTVTYNTDQVFIKNITVENNIEPLPGTPNINDTIRAVDIISSNTDKQISLLKNFMNTNGFDTSSVNNFSELLKMLTNSKMVKCKTGTVKSSNEGDNFQIYASTSTVGARVISIPELDFDPDILICYLKNSTTGTYYTNHVIYIKALDMIFSGQTRTDSYSTSYQRNLVFKSNTSPAKVGVGGAVLPVYCYTYPVSVELYDYFAFKF